MVVMGWAKETRKEIDQGLYQIEKYLEVVYDKI